MNWEALGVVAQFVAATAVVITLVFLTIETRRNRIALESNAVDSLGAGWNALNVHVFSDPALSDLWKRGFADPNSLDDVKLTQFMLMGQSYVNHFMTIKKHHDAGALPEEQWANHASGTAQFMCSPGGRWLRENIAITPDVEAFFRSYDDKPRKTQLLGVTA